jgi:hypothetical protein
MNVEDRPADNEVSWQQRVGSNAHEVCHERSLLVVNRPELDAASVDAMLGEDGSMDGRLGATGHPAIRVRHHEDS